MAQSIEQLERELTKLELAIADLCQQLTTLYPPYLKLFGETIRRQLIMAVYQICTDTHPQAFLQMSLTQRSDLQTKIKHIAHGIHQQILTPLENLQEIATSGFFLEPTNTPDNLLSNSPSNALSNSLSNLPTQVSDDSPKESLHQRQSGKIKALVYWQKQTDTEISQLLQQASQEVNQVLHQAGLLTQKLPLGLLEAAAKMESLNATAIVGKPSILNLMMEVESLKEGKDEELEAEESAQKEPIGLTAVYLRWTELEFHSPELSLAAQSVRSTISKLHNLDREYHRLLKCHQVAQAQAAWRSSWVDD
ncbi:MAG: hypothetical protein HC916_13355 [Coleofasciculaceae cyanobacterium SM2_1_6]|nr:hypothetical protein [Coleofasciculaceae cyanobacterium SM2_1_6]